MKRVIIDTGSSANLVYYEDFKQMKIPKNSLQPMDKLIKGITRNSASPYEKITQKLKFGLGSYSMEREVEFPVARFGRAYNVIISRVT